MKIKIFRSNIDKKNIKNKSTVFENVLFGICILCFIVLIAVQIALVITSSKDNSIGVPLSSDEYLYNQGQMTLKMIGVDPDPTIQILVNGDTVATFENLEMNINVKDGDVIEIDGSQSLTGHIIRVESISTNINSRCTTAVAKVESNIQTLVKVQVDDTH